MALHIVNLNPKYSRAPLIEPTTLGYLHVAAEVEPRRAPLAPNSREKAKLLDELRTFARQLEAYDAVERVTLFDAVAFAPPSAYVQEQLREHPDAIRIPRFDIVALIETRSPDLAREVRATPAYQALMETLTRSAKQVYVVAARDAKRIGDVDKSRRGTFLFNYFVGEDPNVVLQLWDYLAGWYTTETGLDNSTLLVPMEGERSDYVAINHARWDGSLLGVLLRQVSKKTFRTYMLANLAENHVGAMPVLYRLASQPTSPARRVAAVALPLTITAAAIALGVGLGLRRRRSTARLARMRAVDRARIALLQGQKRVAARKRR